jgi:LacI family transcriptional regulator
VIGFDDIPWAPLNYPPLTSIAVPVEEIGEEAVAMLLRRIASPTDAKRRVVFNVSLAERDSVGPPPS